MFWCGLIGSIELSNCITPRPAQALLGSAPILDPTHQRISICLASPSQLLQSHVTTIISPTTLRLDLALVTFSSCWHREAS